MQLEKAESDKADSEPSWMKPAKSDEITQPLPSTAKAAASESEGAATEETEKITAAERSLLQKVIRKGLVENRHDLEVQRKDPNSPLYSIKSFDALNLWVFPSTFFDWMF